jgi:hypothetical protein
MICTICLKEFESKRTDAKFCSSTCRSKASRATDNLSVATDNRTDTETLRPAKDIKERLEEIRLKYKLSQITPALLSKETDLNYSFVPAWLANGLSLSDIKSLAN